MAVVRHTLQHGPVAQEGTIQSSYFKRGSIDNKGHLQARKKGRAEKLRENCEKLRKIAENCGKVQTSIPPLPPG